MSKYFDITVIDQPEDGDTAVAEDINQVTRTIDASFDDVESDMLSYNYNVENAAIPGTLPPEYSAFHYREKSKRYATGDEVTETAGQQVTGTGPSNDSGEAIPDPDSVHNSVMQSAKIYANDSKNYAVDSSTSATISTSASSASSTSASEALTSKNEAATSAANALNSENTSNTNVAISAMYAVGELPLGTPHEPPKGSSKYWANVAASANTFKDNLLSNTGFFINQRAYANGYILNEYGYDMWVAKPIDPGNTATCSLNSYGGSQPVYINSGSGGYGSFAQLSEKLMSMHGLDVTVYIVSGTITVKGCGCPETVLNSTNGYSKTFTVDAHSGSGWFYIAPSTTTPGTNTSFEGLAIVLGSFVAPTRVAWQIGHQEFMEQECYPYCTVIEDGGEIGSCLATSSSTLKCTITLPYFPVRIPVIQGLGAATIPYAYGGAGTTHEMLDSSHITNISISRNTITFDLDKNGSAPNFTTDNVYILKNSTGKLLVETNGY